MRCFDQFSSQTEAARREPVDARLPQRRRFRKRGPRSLAVRERRGRRIPLPAVHFDSSFTSTVPCPPNGVSGRVSSLPSVGCGKS